MFIKKINTTFAIPKPNRLLIMKKFYLFSGLVLVYSFLALAINNKLSKEKLEGKWNVKVINAPSGYQDYIVDIQEDKEKYKADILFVDANYKIINQTFMLKDGKLTGNVLVKNEKVDLSIWEENGVVQGSAKSSSIGTLMMTFSRLKE